MHLALCFGGMHCQHLHMKVVALSAVDNNCINTLAVRAHLWHHNL